jgi:uncharacterized membrane protein
MIPWIESRYVIPYAMWELNWHWWQAFPLAVVGNIIPIPFVLYFFKFIEVFLRKYPFWKKIMDRLFERTRNKAYSKIEKFEVLGLLIFVAIPLPFTGAWTGALIAYLFDLHIVKSTIIIFLGIIISASIMIILYSTGNIIWFSINN